MKIVLGAYGSAGDLFPLAGLARELRSRDHDAQLLVPRALSLYSRFSGVPSRAIGGTEEFQVGEDPRIVTTRFDGWESYRRVWTAYVARSLDTLTTDALAAFEDAAPDVVVASSYATAARLAAAALEIPIVLTSIYPQLQMIPSGSTAFARSYQSAVSRACERLGVDPTTELLWGAADVLLHEPEILRTAGMPELARSAVGYPRWDDMPTSEGEQINAWLSAADRPVAGVSLGSFLGIGRTGLVLEIGARLREQGFRLCFTGVDGAAKELIRRQFGDETAVAVGFVPHSTVFNHCDVVCHHGGLGTSIAAAVDCGPAIVFPLAFDQTWNARLLESAGLGVGVSSLDDLGVAVAKLNRGKPRSRLGIRGAVGAAEGLERAVSGVIE